MGERDDDTPDAGPPAPGTDASPGGRRPGGYYYDDATGYEVYDPEGDEEDTDDEAPGRGGGGHAPCERRG